MKIFVQRNGGGKIVGIFLNPPLFAAEEIDDASPEVLVFQAPPPIAIALPLLQSRIEAEMVGAVDGWTVYEAYMFAAAARRKAFARAMWRGQPIRQDDAPFRASLLGAGFSAAQADRILAAPNGG